MPAHTSRASDLALQARVCIVYVCARLCAIAANDGTHKQYNVDFMCACRAIQVYVHYRTEDHASVLRKIYTYECVPYTCFLFVLLLRRRYMTRQNGGLSHAFGALIVQPRAQTMFLRRYACVHAHKSGDDGGPSSYESHFNLHMEYHYTSYWQNLKSIRIASHQIGYSAAVFRI